MKVTTGQRTGITSLRDYQKISRWEENYSTEDPIEYAAQLKKMNLDELQKHAIRVGLVARSERKTMETLLNKAFADNRRNYLVATAKGIKRKVLTKEQTEKIQDIHNQFLHK